MPSPPFVAIPVAAEETLGWAGLTRQHRTAQPRSRLEPGYLRVCANFVGGSCVFLFWPDNLNEYRHADRRHCEPTTARSGVAPGRAVPSDRESRRFSPGHHFRELSQMR